MNYHSYYLFALDELAKLEYGLLNCTIETDVIIPYDYPMIEYRKPDTMSIYALLTISILCSITVFAFLKTCEFIVNSLIVNYTTLVNVEMVEDELTKCI